MSRFTLVALVALAAFGGGVAWAKVADKWSGKPANPTIEEWMDLNWQVRIRNHDSGSGYQSGSLVEFASGSSPEEALVYVQQAYAERDEITSADRTLMRRCGDMTKDMFEVYLGEFQKAGRWLEAKGSKNLIIRHYRLGDRHETMAVTIDGVTSFEEADIKRAETKVRLVGAFWPR